MYAPDSVGPALLDAREGDYTTATPAGKVSNEVLSVDMAPIKSIMYPGVGGGDDIVATAPASDDTIPALAQKSFDAAIFNESDEQTHEVVETASHPGTSTIQVIMYSGDATAGATLLEAPTDQTSATPAGKRTNDAVPPNGQSIKAIIYHGFAADADADADATKPDPLVLADLEIDVDASVMPVHSEADFHVARATQADQAAMEAIQSKMATVTDEPPDMDLLTAYNMRNGVTGMFGVAFGTGVKRNLPCEIVVRECILSPIMSQAQAVGSAVVNHFLQNLKLLEHLAAIRTYFLMGSAEWSSCLIDGLSKAASTVAVSPRSASSIVNPMLLKTVLATSQQDSDPSSAKLSLGVDGEPTAILDANALETFDFVSLCYAVDWPLNMVIDSSALAVYNQVFKLMVKIRRAEWALTDVRGKMVNRRGLLPSELKRCHHAAIIRQEMQHFTTVFQNYVTHQLLDLSWAELVTPLEQRMQGDHDAAPSLDFIINLHRAVLDKILQRTLLTSNAVPVMRVIEGILVTILRFRAQITMQANVWAPDNFATLLKCHEQFKEYIGFLLKVVQKLLEYGFQPHLEELMMNLDFNEYYVGDAETAI